MVPGGVNTAGNFENKKIILKERDQQKENHGDRTFPGLRVLCRGLSERRDDLRVKNHDYRTGGSNEREQRIYHKNDS